MTSGGINRIQNQTIDEFVKDDLEQMSQAVNYLQYQFEMFQRFLGRRVLEIGAGIGNFTAKIMDKTDLLVAVEPNAYCFNKLSEIDCSRTVLELIPKSLEQICQNSIKSKKLDTILCLNVLEHVEDDARAIRFFHDALIPGGQAIIMVPSPEWAYGSIDKALGHYRRYSKKYLQSIVSEAGFNIVELRYFNPVGCLGWIWNARVTGRVAQSSFQIYIFDKYIVPVQKRLEKYIRFPFGQSLLIVGEKAK